MKVYLTNSEAASYLRWRPQTLARRRWLGLGPVYSKVGGSIRYSIEDLENFIEREA